MKRECYNKEYIDLCNASKTHKSLPENKFKDFHYLVFNISITIHSFLILLSIKFFDMP